MRLIIPEYAIKEKGQRTYHFQDPQRMHRTQCGIIIAGGMGWKRRTAAWNVLKQNTKRIWERKDVDQIPHKSMCPSCLGAMRASDGQQRLL